MERLTTHSKRSNCPIPSEALGDVCMKINFCEDFDFCDGCPVKTMLTRLCEYEDTGLTPNQIENMKKIRQQKICQRTIVGIPKAKKIKQKVSRYGLYIKGKKYYLSDLSTYHFGETVDVIINEQSKHVKVFINDMLVEEFDL